MNKDLPSMKWASLRDHTGKRSNSRVTSFLSALYLGFVIVVHTLRGTEPSFEFLGIVASGALVPIALNRFGTEHVDVKVESE